MKVLHLPTNVAGMSWGLAEGERRLGLESHVLTRSKDWLDYPCDVCLDWENKNKLGMLVSGLKTFLSVRNNYDVFHFNFGETILNYTRIGMYNMELPFYPKGKSKIFTFNGSDARQKYKYHDDGEVELITKNYKYVCNDERMDKLKRESITKTSKYADHIFAVNPDLLNFLPEKISSFLPYSIAPWYKIKQTNYRIEKKIKVVHAPSKRAVKGTSFIIEAIEELKSIYDIEFTLVENIPNETAIDIYKDADLVIDQLFVGWYGGLAVEVMKMGVPVAVYIDEDSLHFIPREMRKDLDDAVIKISKDNLVEILSSCFENTEVLKEKSRASIDYVNRWHDPVNVARLTKEVYENNSSS